MIMKTLSLLIIAVFTTLLLFAQKERSSGECPYDIDIKTNQFIVLDINYQNQLVAFKHIYEKQNYVYYDVGGEVVEKPVNCKYVGMEAYPYSGVILGVYDLKNQEYLKTYTIYQLCTSENLCTTYEQSSKNLEEAKAFFTENGLDISKKPNPNLFDNDSNKIFTLKLGGINFKADYENNYDEMLTISRLYANQKLIYQINQDDNFVMASHGEIYYTTAYSDGINIVFLNKLYHNNHMEGATSYEYYHFSPVFKISD